MTSRRAGPGTIAAIALGVAAIGVLTYVLRSVQSVPEGPQPVAWDREACAHCRMLIGDPRFAAQVHGDDGRILYFDDPGCVFAYLEETSTTPLAIYFHHHREDVWLQRAEVGFVPELGSPMGYGLGAVRRGAPGALSYEQARRRVLAGRREDGRRAGPGEAR